MVNKFDQKEILHRRNSKNMDKKKFKQALASTNWNEALASYCNDPIIFLEILWKMVNYILDKYAPLIVCSFNAPLTQITKKILKTYSKHWLKAFWHQQQK